MDASALIMNDAKIENVQAAIEFTREYGVYDDPDNNDLSLEQIKDAKRSAPGAHQFVEQKRSPGTCIPWLEKKRDFPDALADEGLVKSTWESIDAQGYTFCWTNLTW